VRLVLNEMWSQEIARQLRARGHDVIAATEQPRRYRGVPDREFFLRAQADGRAVVTDNVPDFTRVLREHLGRGQTHYGLFFAVRPNFDRGSVRVVGEMTRALDTLLKEHPGDEPTSAVLFLRS
jgi:hypothetical protein